MHPEFVSLNDFCPDLLIEASYATSENFTGEVVRGYKSKKALLHRVPASGLLVAQKAAASLGLSLKIFDGYRPAKAVAFFLEWAQKPETNAEIKRLYYPTFERMELFEIGYLARRSSHSRGSAVDLTLTDLKSGQDLDMGTMFDYFDSLSHTDSPKVTPIQKKNRELLNRLMVVAGFRNYDKEWWHYTFKTEPFPDQYFDFDIE